MNVSGGVTEQIEAISRLGKDLRASANLLDPAQARYLVDQYYTLQRFRIRAGNQIRAAEQEPHQLLRWIGDNMDVMERNLKSVLGVYAKSHLVGRWSLGIHGIGPIIAAGLIAHDDKPSHTVGALWRYAGLDPTSKWSKGQKRPWNARLKTLCWHIGESFKRHRASPNDIYGKVYEMRKQLEEERNASGVFAEIAKTTLAERKITDKPTREVYESGKLPQGRLDLRATRYATKLFLAHWHDVRHVEVFATRSPLPYVITHLGHVDFVDVPMADAFALPVREPQ